MKFLQHGLFEKDFMQSKAQTQAMSVKERLYGFGLGPGFVMLFTTMVTSLREMFYLQVIPIDKLFGAGSYLRLQTTATILGILGGLVMNYIAERTVSRAGRFRPYVLMGTILMALLAIGMFWTPFGHGERGELVWLWVANMLYYGVATAMFNQRDNMISVSTRSLHDRNFVTTLRNSVGNMIPGIFGALIITNIIYFAILVNDYAGTYWRLLIFITAVIGVAASILEYFWTRERITEDNRSVSVEEEIGSAKVPFGQQLKNLITNKYYLLGILLGLFFAAGANLQGANARTYFTQYILGATAQNQLATIYLMIAMQPIAIGTVVIPILARKHGSRPILIISCILALAGIGVAMIQPYSLLFACLGGLIFSFGSVAMSNMYAVVGQQAADMVEYQHGYRLEGTLAAALVTAVTAMLISPMSALYETVLFNLGYDATLAVQNTAVNNWILFAYYGGYAIQAVGIILVMIFFDAEKKMPEVHAAISARHKAEAEARGEVYVSPEEKERIEREEAERVAEENRIADLKALCEKKGLDFDTENQKYLDKLAAKRAKRETKMARRAKK